MFSGVRRRTPAGTLMRVIPVAESTQNSQPSETNGRFWGPEFGNATASLRSQSAFVKSDVRPAALVIAITMLGAIGIVHFRFGLFLNWFGNKKGHGIEYHLLVIALALVVFVKGGGAFALDGLLSEHVFRVEQSVACDEQPNQNLELRTKINISGGFHE